VILKTTMPRPLTSASALFVMLLGMGCSMPRGMNDHCNWPAGSAHEHERTGQPHLVADARVAEELAMRYADRRYDSKAAHGRLRSECEAKLFEQIAISHGVTLAAVEQARRDLAANRWDAPVHLPLAAFYIAAAALLARSIRRRFPPDEKVAAVLATLFISVVLAIVVQVLGHLWDGVVEMIRVGNTHMSHRVERLGWRQYSEEVFVLTLVAFWCGVLFSYRIRKSAAASGLVGSVYR
jgi:hypothetical protein